MIGWWGVCQGFWETWSLHLVSNLQVTFNVYHLHGAVEVVVRYCFGLPFVVQRLSFGLADPGVVAESCLSSSSFVFGSVHCWWWAVGGRFACFSLLIVAGWSLLNVVNVSVDVLDISLDYLCYFLTESCDHFLFEVCNGWCCVLCVHGVNAVVGGHACVVRIACFMFLLCWCFGGWACLCVFECSLCVQHGDVVWGPVWRWMGVCGVVVIVVW